MSFGNDDLSAPDYAKLNNKNQISNEKTGAVSVAVVSQQMFVYAVLDETDMINSSVLY